MSGFSRQTLHIAKLKSLPKQLGRALRDIRLLNADLGQPEDLSQAAAICGNVEHFLLTAQTRLEDAYQAELKAKQFWDRGDRGGQL